MFGTAFTMGAWDNFLSSLIIMGEGMLGVFVFMSVFYGLIILLRRVFPPQPGDKET